MGKNVSVKYCYDGQVCRFDGRCSFLDGMGNVHYCRYLKNPDGMMVPRLSKVDYSFLRSRRFKR